MTSSIDAGSVAAALEYAAEVDVGVGVLNDADLLQLIGASDTKALALFYRRHGPASLWLACHLIGDCTLAEEVTREAFVSIWCGGGDRPEGEDAREWILGIVRRRAIGALSRSGRPAQLCASRSTKAAAGHPPPVAMDA